jgi:hypothetical protein
MMDMDTGLWAETILFLVAAVALCWLIWWLFMEGSDDE